MQTAVDIILSHEIYSMSRHQGAKCRELGENKYSTSSSVKKGYGCCLDIRFNTFQGYFEMLSAGVNSSF